MSWTRSCRGRVPLLLAASLVLLPTGFFLFEFDGQQPAALQTDSDSASAGAAPNQHGWETETFSAAALGQLHTLGELIEQPDAIGAGQLASLATAEFSCDSLRPYKLEKVFADAAVKISRLRNPAEPADPHTTGTVHSGIAGFREALQSLSAPLADGSGTHVKFKIYRVEIKSEAAVTRTDFQFSGNGPDGFVQQNATWLCHWIYQADSDVPLLKRIELLEFEEAVAHSSPGRLFVDCSQAVLGHDDSIREQLSRGADYWKYRLQAELKVSPYGHHGLVVGDVNGDGLEDVYLCQSAGQPNRLFLQQPDGTATDASAAAGVDWLDRSFGALLIDIDNDDDQDLAIVMDANLMLMANDGTGRFSERAIIYVTEDPYSLAAADYDDDGDLDLYLASYGNRVLGANNTGSSYEPPFPYHDANNGSRNSLLRNDGDWRFTNVTRACGLDENNRRWSFAASWEDYDNDGDQDLYVANDFGRNNLYRNDGGRFADVAASAGVEDIAAGMSVSWGDYNNDGWMDLYVGNMFSSAGERIAYQRQFQPGAREGVRHQFQRHARGNTLFENAGNGTFRDVSVEQAVTMGRWAWGSTFFDLNNDGWEDLLVANGFITGSDTDDL